MMRLNSQRAFLYELMTTINARTRPFLIPATKCIGPRVASSRTR
jgi:hypothetical protein